jgi:hypothetical protein
MADTDNVRPFPGVGPEPRSRSKRRSKDSTGALRSKRYRSNKRDAERDGGRGGAVGEGIDGKHDTVPREQASPTEKPNEIKPNVTAKGASPIVTETVVCTYPASAIQSLVPSPPFVPPKKETAAGGQHGRAIDITAYVVAVALAGAAAFFSIRGMVVIFPGSPVPVVVMAIAMESAKLVTAGWLARRWTSTAKLWRAALIPFVFGLAVINAAGVYAQLVSAHVGELGAAQSTIETQDAALAAKLESQNHIVADLDRRVAQIDGAIEDANRRGKTKTAMATMETQRKARQSLVEERNREAATLAALKAERASVASKERQIETEAAPIQYVASIFGVTDPEVAIRWLIALMVLCCDPLAIGLTAAVSARRSTPA